MLSNRTVAVLTIIVMLMGCAHEQARKAEIDSEDGWSAAGNGIRGRITLSRDGVVDGTAWITVRLGLKNVQNVSNSMSFAGSRARLSLLVEDGNGKLLSATSLTSSGGGVYVPDVTLPPTSEISFDIMGQGEGILPDKFAMILLTGQVIPRDGKDYFMRGSLEIPEVKDAPSESDWYGKLEFPAVKVPTKPQALGAAATRNLIEELGPKMLTGDEDAARRMSLIEDSRVIPWHVKAVGSSSYEVKFQAIDRLGGFNGNQALEGLKKAMTTQGAEFESPRLTDWKVAKVLAENIRFDAALSLARSPHPDAKKLLLSMWNDSCGGVRIKVAQTAEDMSTSESMATLDRLTRDADVGVREAAADCLKIRLERQSKPK